MTRDYINRLIPGLTELPWIKLSSDVDTPGGFLGSLVEEGAMNTTEEERQDYLRVANELEACGDSTEREDVDFLRRVIGHVGKLERELRSLLPLHAEGGCLYCRNSYHRSADKMHPWEQQKIKCLYHPKYASARAVLGIPDEPATCVTCGKPDTM